VDWAKHVKILGEEVSVKARVFTIGGFSAHADQNDLLEWAGHFESKPRVFLVHGEPVATEALAGKLKQRLGLEVHIPKWKERLILKPREVVVETSPELEAPSDPQALMLNAILDLEKELTVLRRRMKSREKIEKEDVDRVKFIQEEIKGML